MELPRARAAHLRGASYSPGLALCAVVAARLSARAEPHSAARLLGMADQLQMLSATDHLRSDQVRTMLRDHLDEVSIAREWMLGQALQPADLSAKLERLNTSPRQDEKSARTADARSG